ncbi:MAG: hypothetical protein DWG76_05470 [Chloroflexi bacterium]|nr:hypothetical protein [Chloroflexota bacterium]
MLPGARLLAGALFFLALAILFRRLRRPVNAPFFILLSFVSIAVFTLVPVSPYIALPALIAALLWITRRAHSAQPYQSALARIEGGGIKRGLTPPEAAVLLGKPLNLTLTLVLFEMLRKGFLTQVADWPLTLEVAPTFRTHGSGLTTQQRGDLRRKAAQAIMATLHLYEEAFLEILESLSVVAAPQVDYSIAIQPLVRFVAGRVGGHDLEETRDYYRLIIDRAPKEARSDGVLTHDRQKVFDRNFGWVLLGENFGSVLDAPDYSYTPVWLRAAKFGLNGKSFAAWAADIINSMQGVVAEDEVNLSLQRETDQISATLMNEIARATFYG